MGQPDVKASWDLFTGFMRGLDRAGRMHRTPGASKSTSSDGWARGPDGHHQVPGTSRWKLLSVIGRDHGWSRIQMVDWANLINRVSRWQVGYRDGSGLGALSADVRTTYGLGAMTRAEIDTLSIPGLEIQARYELRGMARYIHDHYDDDPGKAILHFDAHGEY